MATDVLKYGWVSGGRSGYEIAVTNDEYFHRLGGAFVTASGGSGHIKIVSAWTEDCIGWAEVPRAAVPGTVDFWKSSATPGYDKVFVIDDPTAVFAMPVAEGAASLSASNIGRYMNATWTGSGSTYKQLVDAVATTITANAMFKCVGVDTDNRVAFVRVEPVHRVS